MYGGCIERIIPSHDAQKSCCLLKCLAAQTRHPLQLLAAGKTTIAVAIADDALGDTAGKAGNPRKQGG